MSETTSLNEKKVYFEAPNEDDESSGGAFNNDSPGNEGVTPAVAENSEPPSINVASATSSDYEESHDQQPAAVMKGKQSDEMIEKLAALIHGLLEAASNPATTDSTHKQRNKGGRKRFFGLSKGLLPETGSNDRYDYEYKYPRDRFGEEATENARIWSTYLDEAESFDRERVEGWKETADVLLVFAGLFSGVITAFVSQAFQSLQRDNTQVSASLLFEIAQILRAQSSGIPINIPDSILTPTSPFTPSTNAVLVNGLWFTSLTIALSTALFAVLAKQWLYYYLTSVSGTPHEKARARQLRFKGFELWKVGAIVELLPILLHIAVGIFLTGIIILLFPLDVRVAWTLVVITGITYVLYFISVLLPIQYPECPYTTSLTIYIGILVFSMRRILRWISSRTLEKGFQAVWRRMNFNARHTIRRVLHSTQLGFINAGFYTLKFLRRGFRKLRFTIFADGFPKFTNWREENIKKAVKDAGFLDLEALNWLYGTSPNRSVHRIIARCVAVHPTISLQLNKDSRENLLQTLKVSETNVLDLRYGLCLDLLTGRRDNWLLLRSIPDVEENQLEEAEYRNYSLISENVLYRNYGQILKDAINNDLELPLVMWHFFSFKEESADATIAAHILPRLNGLFEWKFDSTRGSIRNAGAVSLYSEELGWWKFEYLSRHFLDDTEPNYSLENTFETRYRLLITIYRNLTSDEPLIADKEQRHKPLYDLFNNFLGWLYSESKPRHLSAEQYFAFFIDICCADAFWSESMTDDIRETAAYCVRGLYSICRSRPVDMIDVANQFLSPIYQWCSRDLHPRLSWCTAPIFALLFVPSNRNSLCTILSDDSDAVCHFTNCFRNLGNCAFYFSRKYVYPNLVENLMDTLKSVNPKVPLFNILYNSSVIVQVWKFIVFQKFDAKKFLLVVKSKLDQEKLDELYAAMNEEAQAELTQSNEDFDADSSEDLGSDEGTDVLDALKASADDFGQIIGVSRPRLDSTTEKSAPEHAVAADKDHDTEERAQEPGTNGRKGFHSIIANWTKKAFGSVLPKTSVE